MENRNHEVGIVIAVLEGVIVIRAIIERYVEVVVLVLVVIEVVVVVVEVFQLIIIELVVVIEVVQVAAEAPRLLEADCQIGDGGERVTEDGAWRYRK